MSLAARAAQNRVGQPSGVLVLLEAILVSGHPLKLQCVHGAQVAVALDEAFRIQEVFDSLLGRLGEVVIATRADPLVLGQLDFVHDFFAARTFLKEALRDIAAAFPGAATADGRSLENSHLVRPGPRLPRKRKGRRPP